MKLSQWLQRSAVVLSMTACAGSQAPAASSAAAQAAIRSAREVGAERDPTAALHLQYAREQFERAEQLSQRGDGEEAHRMLLRAQADAELAMAITRRVASRASTVQVDAQTRAIENSPTP